MTIPGLPAPSLVFGTNRTAKAGPSRPVKKIASLRSGALQKNGESSRSAEETRAVELDNRGYERPLTKREKANVSWLPRITRWARGSRMKLTL
jgi:hypothetical protein